MTAGRLARNLKLQQLQLCCFGENGQNSASAGPLENVIQQVVQVLNTQWEIL